MLDGSPCSFSLGCAHHSSAQERELLRTRNLKGMFIPNLGGWVADESVPQLVERVSG